MSCCEYFLPKNTHNQLGIVVDAIIDILKSVRIGPIHKWADNLFPVRFPINSVASVDGSVSYCYSYDLPSLRKLLLLSASLGMRPNGTTSLPLLFTSVSSGTLINTLFL